LDAHIAALIHVLDAAEGVADSDGDSPLARLASHEHRYLRRALSQREVEIHADHLGAVLLVAALYGAQTADQAKRALGELEHVRASDRDVVAMVIHEMWGDSDGAFWATPRPSALADFLVAHGLAGDSDGVLRLIPLVDKSQVAHMMFRLFRAAMAYAELEQLIIQLVTRYQQEIDCQLLLGTGLSANPTLLSRVIRDARKECEYVDLVTVLQERPADLTPAQANLVWQDFSRGLATLTTPALSSTSLSLTTEEPGLAARESALTNGIEVLLTGARDMLKIYGEAIAAIQRASDKTLAQQWEVAAEQLRVKCVAASQEAKATADLLAAASSADSPSAAAALARTASEKARTAAGILHGIRLPSTMADSATSPQATALASAMESTRAARARLTVLLKSLGIPSASENDS
jgi:hypothetical protein